MQVEQRIGKAGNKSCRSLLFMSGEKREIERFFFGKKEITHLPPSFLFPTLSHTHSYVTAFDSPPLIVRKIWTQNWSEPGLTMPLLGKRASLYLPTYPIIFLTHMCPSFIMGHTFRFLLETVHSTAHWLQTNLFTNWANLYSSIPWGLCFSAESL